METSKEARIRERAYQIWKDDGEPHGQDQAHWQRAAAEVDAEAAGVTDGAEPDTKKPARRATVKNDGSASGAPSKVAEQPMQKTAAKAKAAVTEPGAAKPKPKPRAAARSKPAEKN